MNKGHRYLVYNFIAFVVLLFLTTTINAQKSIDFATHLRTIEASNDDANILVQKFTHLKKQLEKNDQTDDSVYARVIDRIAFYECNSGVNMPGEICFTNTEKAIQINLGKKGSVHFLAKEYANLGYYFYLTSQYHNALINIDNAINICTKFNIEPAAKNLAIYWKGNVLEDMGELSSAIDVFKVGLQQAKDLTDTILVKSYYKRLGNVYHAFGKNKEALSCADSCLYYLQFQPDISNQLDALKVKALCYKDLNNYTLAEDYFNRLLRLQKNYTDSIDISINLIEAGNFYKAKSNYNKAIELYKQAAVFSKTSIYNSQYIRCNINICYLYTLKKEYNQALPYYTFLASLFAPGFKGDFLQNPSADQLSLVSEKEPLQTYLNNKTELLILLYKEKKNKAFLNAALQTAMLADSVLTQMRFEQTEEQSKLYWRRKTREQYTLAMEACSLANNTQLAYTFMEKSRAVLLNDNLKEIGAASLLPPHEVIKQTALREKIRIDYDALLNLNIQSAEYNDAQNQLMNDKQTQIDYIQSLEKKYPAYYQYKYNSNNSSLYELQQYLKKKNAGFISYFTADTSLYILSVSATSTHLVKRSKNDYCNDSIATFYSLCTNKQKLMNDYTSFARLSNYLYKQLFLPSGLKMNNIIVCPDEFLIPFEAFCSDNNGKNFLVKSHAFSYVYSSTFLLYHFKNQKSKGNFLGFAPVSFSNNLKLYNLNQSAEVLKTTASYYNDSKLFTSAEASRKNFLDNAGNYQVVTVLSHAKSNKEDEPVLYMCDSSIRLSELQDMPRQAAHLIVLSACETNTGKLATGEGIYSLARGFATAGVPAVAATLWKADELAIYSVTEKFHQYLAQGLTKDAALQKAKIDYLEENSGSNSLPYYWANMVLMGNTDCIEFSKNNDAAVWIISGCVLITITALTIIFKRKKRNQKINR